MNTISRNLLILLAVIIAICFVGQYDYNSEIIYNMSNETYCAIKKKLSDVSESKIVDEYTSNKAYWDSIENQY